MIFSVRIRLIKISGENKPRGNARGNEKHMAETGSVGGGPQARSTLPYADRINAVTIEDTFGWLAAGWRDFRRAPLVSAAYGAIFVVGGLIITSALFAFGYEYLLAPLAIGFLIVGPALTVGFYAISRELEAGRRPRFATAITAWRKNPIPLVAAGFALLTCMFIWVRVAVLIIAVSLPYQAMTVTSMVSVLFTPQALGAEIAGLIVGGLIGLIVYVTSVISLPMMLDRRVDLLEAVVTSVVAVLLNTRTLLAWACLIVIFTFAGLATGYVGLIVTLPLIGHASWHAYRAVVKSDESPAPIAHAGVGAEHKGGPAQAGDERSSDA